MSSQYRSSRTRGRDRRWFLQGSAIAAAGVTAGARSGRRARGQEASGSDFTREASITSWGFGTDNALSEARIAAFQAAFPNIQLELVPQYDDQVLLTAAASGTLPDVLWVDRFKISSYASRNILLTLDDLVAQSEIDLGQFYEGALNEATYDGALYGIPQFMDVRPLYVNLDALAEIGVEVGDLDTSDWDSLTEIGAQLVQRDGDRVERWGFDPKLADFFWMWGMGNGGSFIAGDGLDVTYDDPNLVEALQWGVGAYDAQGGFQSFDGFRSTFQGNEEFARGQVAITAYENWMLGIIGRTVPELNFAVLPVRQWGGEGLVSFTGGLAWSIPANARDPEAAWEFIKFMNADETWVAGASADKQSRQDQGQFYIPSLTANRRADQLLIDEVYEPLEQKFDDAVRLFPELLAESPNRPVSTSPVGGQLQDILNQEAVLPALRGELDAQQALEQADASAQNAVDSF
ncbi:MAG: ABC transporter substrate-binding protein [Chloroflexota bacterium]|nr:ABC transporter substrate-binding protein [Chloroflexota bacterium]